jgi:hypothetical protein
MSELRGTWVKTSSRREVHFALALFFLRRRRLPIFLAWSGRREYSSCGDAIEWSTAMDYFSHILRLIVYEDRF